MTYRLILLCALSLVVAACSARDPLVGEFLAKEVGNESAKDAETARFQVAKRDNHYLFSMWDDRKKNWSGSLVLEACPSEAYGLLGARWQTFDPVGACTKGLFIIYSRTHKAIPRMTTTGYFAFMYMAFGGGGVFELTKVK